MKSRYRFTKHAQSPFFLLAIIRIILEGFYQATDGVCNRGNVAVLVEANSHAELDACKNTFSLKNFKVS